MRTGRVLGNQGGSAPGEGVTVEGARLNERTRSCFSLCPVTNTRAFWLFIQDRSSVFPFGRYFGRREEGRKEKEVIVGEGRAPFSDSTRPFTRPIAIRNAPTVVERQFSRAIHQRINGPGLRLEATARSNRWPSAYRATCTFIVYKREGRERL